MSAPPLAVVTGASSRLGRAIALALAQQGYAIGVHYYRSLERAQRLAEEIARVGASAWLLQADLSDGKQIDSMFRQVAQWQSPLRVLVQAAGIMLRGDPLSTTEDVWDHLFGVNLRAAWLCARAAAPLMGGAGGVIINVSDCGAQRLWTNYMAYVLSKAALEHLTRLLAKAFAPSIRVNAVAPGLISPGPDTLPEEWERLIHRVPLQRQGDPEAIAHAVLFLIESNYITGQVLAVDGGYQLV